MDIYTRHFADEITGTTHADKADAVPVIIDLTREQLGRYYAIFGELGTKSAFRYAVGCIDQRRDGRRQT